MPGSGRLLNSCMVETMMPMKRFKMVKVASAVLKGSDLTL
jgi:hypothetical protein